MAGAAGREFELDPEIRRSSSRPACTVAPRMAVSAPALTNGTVFETRCDDMVDKYSTASTRLVLPCPLGPTNTVTPAPRLNRASA